MTEMIAPSRRPARLSPPFAAAAAAVLDHTAKKGEPLRAGSGQLARMVPTFHADDLARMAGYSKHRKSRQRALTAFERLAAEGLIDLQPRGERWRIPGPQAPVSEAVSARPSLPSARL